jgi:hypothetical protein
MKVEELKILFLNLKGVIDEIKEFYLYEWVPSKIVVYLHYALIDEFSIESERQEAITKANKQINEYLRNLNQDLTPHRIILQPDFIKVTFYLRKNINRF